MWKLQVSNGIKSIEKFVELENHIQISDKRIEFMTSNEQNKTTMVTLFL
jgi:hypothetical protein